MTAVIVAAICCGYSAAHAYFERVVPSARSAALGGAFVAVADDPAAVLTNPAGLALIKRTGALATYDRPYNLGELNESDVAAAIPSRIGVFGGAWHFVGLSGALTENIVTLAYARHLIATTQDASLSIGVDLDFYRAAADATGESDNALTGGAGVLLRPFPMIGIGYAVRNLIEYDIHLLSGAPGTRLYRQQAWGLSYKWNNRVTLSVERRQDAAEQWRNHGGVEVVTHPNLHLRAGLNNGDVTGGFGVLWRGIRLDIAVVSNGDLGSSYLISIGWLPKVKNPYAQSP
jgi:hypothetical protein